LDQRDVASVIGCTRSAVSYWEKTGRVPQSKMSLLAKALQVDEQMAQEQRTRCELSGEYECVPGNGAPATSGAYAVTITGPGWRSENTFSGDLRSADGWLDDIQRAVERLRVEVLDRQQRTVDAAKKSGGSK
jgi:transcriptional regulator with XRE-family HTH domain